MLRLCVCENTAEDMEAVEALVGRFAAAHPDLPLHTERFASPYDLLDRLERGGGFDLYLLDILMPEMDGVALARFIRARGETAELIFLTASREYTLDAFDVSASGYLLKPVKDADFERTLLTAVRRLPEDGEALLLKTAGGIRKVLRRELAVVESDLHHSICMLADGTTLDAGNSLSSIAELLRGDPRFYAPHRAYLVNLDYVSGLNAGEAVLKNGKRVPVSRKLSAAFKTAYMDFVFHRCTRSYHDIL